MTVSYAPHTLTHHAHFRPVLYQLLQRIAIGLDANPTLTSHELDTTSREEPNVQHISMPFSTVRIHLQPYGDVLEELTSLIC